MLSRGFWIGSRAVWWGGERPGGRQEGSGSDPEWAGDSQMGGRRSTEEKIYSALKIVFVFGGSGCQGVIAPCGRFRRRHN